MEKIEPDLPSMSDTLEDFRRSEACLAAQSTVLAERPEGGRFAIHKKENKIFENSEKNEQPQKKAH